MTPSSMPSAADKSASPDISIIIVSWNIRNLLSKCLESIEARDGSLDLEVIVVDSGSNDGTAEMLRALFPWVQLIACEENVGFPKGNNLGIERALGDFVLLLNPDTEILGDALLVMRDFLSVNHDVGIVGPLLLNSDGSTQSSRRRFPTVMTGVFESTWLQPLAPRSLMDSYYAKDMDDHDQADVDWLVGACLMTRQEVIEQVGLLDEDYFMYSEELDWCRRVKEGGWRIVYFPKAEVLHHVGKSSEQAVMERHVNYQRAKLRYFRKFHGWTPAFFLRIVLLMNYAIQIIIEGVKGLFGHKRPLRWQRIRAYCSVLRSGLKPAGY